MALTGDYIIPAPSHMHPSGVPMGFLLSSNSNGGIPNMLTLEQQKQLREIVRTQRDYQRKLLDLATTSEQVRIIGNMTGDIVQLLGDEWMCEEAAVTPKKAAVSAVADEPNPVAKAVQGIIPVSADQRAKLAYEMFIEWRNGLPDTEIEKEAYALISQLAALTRGTDAFACVLRLETLMSNISFATALQAFCAGGQLAPVSTWIENQGNGWGE